MPPKSPWWDHFWSEDGVHYKGDKTHLATWCQKCLEFQIELLFNVDDVGFTTGLVSCLQKDEELHKAAWRKRKREEDNHAASSFLEAFGPDHPAPGNQHMHLNKCGVSRQLSSICGPMKRKEYNMLHLRYGKLLDTTSGHKTLLWCCQDEDKKQKLQPSQREGAKH
ncbi:hypothetical protein F5J12DRAFT_780812 [Pisolithus orientalis]|uniref:uncharacterized protein n=1 Tax=Pisolithus orientalis TaxID=936130 RepID=UPI0022256B46|nr:uncharacterized protein F5J12DRAFT_780812 [Pisolithus orientalis]KAI6019707.1 hypothetical protein F5J12DRAFT_780812 [Pisolithus orientalis]